MYDAVNDPDKPLADEVEKDLDPDKTFVEFSTSALAVMEDVGKCFSVLKTGFLTVSRSSEYLIKCWSEL